MALNQWMEETVGEIKTLANITLPGSHDAAMYVHLDSQGREKKNPSASIITQSQDIYHQLMDGYRMFDLRVYREKGQKSRSKLYCGHFSEKWILGGSRGRMDKFGGFGDKLENVLNQVGDFINNEGRQETVILKFSHIHVDNTSAVLNLVHHLIRKNLLIVPEDTTIGNIKFRHLRGKVIAVYDSKFKGAVDARGGDYKRTAVSRYRPIFFKNLKKKKTWKKPMEDSKKSHQLILRGEYSNRRTYNDMKKIQWDLLSKWYVKGDKGAWFPGELMQLYWTSTYNIRGVLASTNILENTKPLWTETGCRDLTYFIKRYAPNIVISDFADETKAKVILGL